MIKYLLGVLSGILIFILVLGLIPMPEERIYDCRLSEISPDFPPDVKKECRKRLMDSQNKQFI